MKLSFKLVLVLSLMAGLSAGCAGTPTATTSEGGHDMLAMAAMEDMPVQVQTAPVAVREAYQFAVANPAVLQELPCYCGCGPIGHKSNYDCYVVGSETSGALTYDAHALGCDICIDITQDAMRMLREGKAVPDIRAYVDGAYSRFGSSNMP
jgi:hypothetical protein